MWSCTRDCVGRCAPSEPIGCSEPNPQGCRDSSACEEGEQCVREEGECAPSSCQCDPELGAWLCTRDCVGRCVTIEDDTDPLECPPIESLCDAVCLGLTPDLPEECSLPTECRCAPQEECVEPNPQGCREDRQCEPDERCVFIDGECAPSSCSCDVESGAWRCTRDCVGSCAPAGACPDISGYCEALCAGEPVPEIPEGCPIPRCRCPEVCEPRERGPLPPPRPCPDGGLPEMSCEPDMRGECAWRVGTCPEVMCPPDELICAAECDGISLEVPRGCALPDCSCDGPTCPDPARICRAECAGLPLDIPQECPRQECQCEEPPEPVCMNGEERPADDDCNTCVCRRGAWVCTTVACPEGNDCEDVGGICRADRAQAGACLEGETRIRSACGEAGQACCLAQDPRPRRCGGFTGELCPEGFECVDDPTDQCDPERGGADCLGICQPQEPTACCEALTAACLACAAGQSVEEYCRNHPRTLGCEPDEPGDACDLLCSEEVVINRCTSAGLPRRECLETIDQLVARCRSERCERE